MVGAGPAGTSAALTMAKGGLSVALIERGESPGAKNVFGGVVYKWPLEEIIPKFWEKAPIERKIIDHRMVILGKDSGFSVSYKDDYLGMETRGGFTALRSRFDPWFAQQAEEAGATLVTSMPVSEVIEEGGRVVGIRAGRGKENELYAQAIVAADGVMSTVLQKAGIRGPPAAEDVAIGLKEVIELPSDTIESRFNLKRGYGARLDYLGSVARGKSGGGFVYTNSNTLSVGIAVLLSHLLELRCKPYEILDEFKSHPVVAPLLEGGRVKEYQAHLIPEGGLQSIPPLASRGVLAVGDAAMLCLYPEGTNMAMASGVMAGKTILESKKTGDFSIQRLMLYERLMKESYIFKEHSRKKNYHNILTSGDRFNTDYPDAITEIMRNILVVDGVDRGSKHAAARKVIRDKVGYVRVLRDLYRDIWSALPW